jgi:hypothetical protein
MLPLDPPFHLIVRKVVKPATIGGRELTPGELCWQLIPAANRDPRFTAGAEPAVRKTDAIISRGWLTLPVALTGRS